MYPPRPPSPSDRKLHYPSYSGALKAVARGQTVAGTPNGRAETLTGQVLLGPRGKRPKREPFEPFRGAGPLKVKAAPGYVMVRGVKAEFAGDDVTLDDAAGTKWVWVKFRVDATAPGTITLETSTSWPSAVLDLNTYGYIVVAECEVEDETLRSFVRRWFGGDIYFPGL